jgi:hypothetical protein
MNVDIFFLVIVFAILGILIFLRERKDGYDYDRENPNALIMGKNVSGTVWASDEDTPGLGWVL